MEYKFSALSSNKTDRYEVVVFEISGQIGISCDCPATAMCKHKSALITGSTSGIFPEDFNNPKDLNAATELIIRSGLAKKHHMLISELEEIKKEFKRQEKDVKRQLNELCVPIVPWP